MKVIHTAKTVHGLFI